MHVRCVVSSSWTTLFGPILILTGGQTAAPPGAKGGKPAACLQPVTYLLDLWRSGRVSTERLSCGRLPKGLVRTLGLTETTWNNNCGPGEHTGSNSDSGSRGNPIHKEVQLHEVPPTDDHHQTFLAETFIRKAFWPEALSND